MVSPQSDFTAWLIDLDGTLYRQLPVKLVMAAELCFAGTSVWRVIRTFRREHEQLREAARNGTAQSGNPFHDQLKATARKLDVPVASVENTVTRWMFDRPSRWLKHFRRESLIREIREFRQAGGRTAVVSDYPARTKLKALGIADLFDEVIASGDAKDLRLKPAPDGFLLAARRLGVSPGECLVIGDRSDADGLAARQAGMTFRKVPGSLITDSSTQPAHAAVAAS